MAQKWSAEGEGEGVKSHPCILLFFLFCCTTFESVTFSCDTFVDFLRNVLECSVFVVNVFKSKLMSLRD